LCFSPSHVAPLSLCHEPPPKKPTDELHAGPRHDKRVLGTSGRSLGAQALAFEHGSLCPTKYWHFRARSPEAASATAGLHSADRLRLLLHRMIYKSDRRSLGFLHRTARAASVQLNGSPFRLGLPNQRPCHPHAKTGTPAHTDGAALSRRR